MQSTAAVKLEQLGFSVVDNGVAWADGYLLIRQINCLTVSAKINERNRHCPVSWYNCTIDCGSGGKLATSFAVSVVDKRYNRLFLSYYCRCFCLNRRKSKVLPRKVIEKCASDDDVDVDKKDHESDENGEFCCCYSCWNLKLAVAGKCHCCLLWVCVCSSTVK